VDIISTNDQSSYNGLFSCRHDRANSLVATLRCQIHARLDGIIRRHRSDFDVWKASAQANKLGVFQSMTCASLEKSNECCPRRCLNDTEGKPLLSEFSLWVSSHHNRTHYCASTDRKRSCQAEWSVQGGKNVRPKRGGFITPYRVTR